MLAFRNDIICGRIEGHDGVGRSRVQLKWPRNVLSDIREESQVP
jgi:hypothetical protein